MCVEQVYNIASVNMDSVHVSMCMVCVEQLCMYVCVEQVCVCVCARACARVHCTRTRTGANSPTAATTAPSFL